MEDEGVLCGDLLEQVDVTLDEFGFGDDAEAIAGAAGEDFEERAGDFRGALDGLVRIGGGTEGDFFGGINLSELLLEEPGGVVFQVDVAFEGGLPGWRFAFGDGRGGGLEELVGVAGVAVAAGELAAAVRVDGIGE